MEKINYISGKEENFWKILRVIFGIIYLFFLMVGVFSEEPNPFFWLLAIGCMGLSAITNIPQKFIDKDVSEIRKRMLLWAIVLVIYLAFVTSLGMSQLSSIGNPNVLRNNSNAKIAVIMILSAPLVIFLLLEILKTKIRKSHTFFKYLVDEKPAFWKNLFHKDIFSNSYPESILGILFFVLAFGGSITMIIWGFDK
jgi:hypothetical protein